MKLFIFELVISLEKFSFDCEKNQILTLDKMSEQTMINLKMHGLTYKTQLLKQINYKQTEGISHTDNEWCFYPMSAEKTFCYFNDGIFLYTIDSTKHFCYMKTFRETIELDPIPITRQIWHFKKGRQYKNPLYEPDWIGNETRNFRKKDNDKCYISSGAACWGHQRIRVPKLRASVRVWKNFYRLFPFLKGELTYKGIKLRQI